MCGISGIIHKHAGAVSPAAIHSITDLIAHRGPDDEGFFFGEQFALGHRRLSILDLSADGHQPMHYLERYVITFNGEIYNYVELREQLSGEGYRFASKTDTEVILAAYDKWGQDCVERFNGMWAFCLYDKQQQLLFCSRDRFGVKPFYYADTPNQFIFGSEIKQILAARGGAAVANLHAVRDFLVEGYTDHTLGTFFEGVQTLAAGHNLVYSLKSHRFRQSRFYNLAAPAGLCAMDEASATARFMAEFRRSIAYRLRSDVKVGTSLSGGLDSSSIASLSAALYHQSTSSRFQAIHAKAGVGDTDESGYAQELASHCDIDLTVIEPSVAEFAGAIDEVAYLQEEPFASPSIFMQYFVFKKAKDIACKVMLDGQGADEILLGYERYYATYLRAIPWFDVPGAIFFIKRHCRLSARELLGYLLYFTVSPVRRWRLRRKFSFVKPMYVHRFIDSKAAAGNHGKIRSLQKSEIETFQLPSLLRYQDRNSMRHSIEARLPFLDYRVVEAAFGMNQHFKIRERWTKYVLRSAMRDILPADIVWNKIKLAFEAPTATWLKAASGEMQETIRQSQILKTLCKGLPDFDKLDDSTFWKLFSIAKWEAVYSVRLAAPASAAACEQRRQPSAPGCAEGCAAPAAVARQRA